MALEGPSAGDTCRPTKILRLININFMLAFPMSHRYSRPPRNGQSVSSFAFVQSSRGPGVFKEDPRRRQRAYFLEVLFHFIAFLGSGGTRFLTADKHQSAKHGRHASRKDDG